MLPLLKAVARGTVGWKALKNAEDFPSQQKKKKKRHAEGQGWGNGAFLSNVPVAISKRNTDPSLFRTGGDSKCLNSY